MGAPRQGKRRSGKAKWLLLGCGGIALVACGAGVAFFAFSEQLGGPGTEVVSAELRVGVPFEVTYVQQGAEHRDVWLALDAELERGMRLSGPVAIADDGEPFGLYTLDVTDSPVAPPVQERTTVRTSKWLSKSTNGRGTVTGRTLLFPVPPREPGTEVTISGVIHAAPGVSMNDLRMMVTEPSLLPPPGEPDPAAPLPAPTERQARLARALMGAGEELLRSGQVKPLQGPPIEAQGSPPENPEDALLSVGWRGSADAPQELLYHVTPFDVHTARGGSLHVDARVVAITDLRTDPVRRVDGDFERVEDPTDIGREEHEGTRLYGNSYTTLLGPVTEGQQGRGYYDEVEVIFGPIPALFAHAADVR